MKHKHFIGNLLLASSVLFTFSSCLDENDDKFKEEEQKREQEKETWDKIQDVTISGQVDGYDYVDLGLSTQWATYNVGATKPTEPGDHFSWGETISKKDYDIDKYKWSQGTGTSLIITKYQTDKSDTVSIDDKRQLDPEDDAATANWGKNWRMPTTTELAELINGCNWKSNFDFKGTGVSGLVGVSKINGNVIFFPAAESLSSIQYNDQNIHRGYYWSSSLSEQTDMYATYFYFNSSMTNTEEVIVLFEHDRFSGRSVRAVTTSSK